MRTGICSRYPDLDMCSFHGQQHPRIIASLSWYSAALSDARVPRPAFVKTTDKALISVPVSFEKDLKTMAGDMTKWLTSRDCSEYVQNLKVVGYFKSLLSSVFVTMPPFSAWIVLDSNPAYKLLNFMLLEILMLAWESCHQKSSLGRAVVWKLVIMIKIARYTTTFAWVVAPKRASPYS